MDHSDQSYSDAAEVVLKERQRLREEEEREKKRAQSNIKSLKPPQLEAVSTPKWEGAEQGQVDESELERRQRALTEQLEKKQLEVQRQGKKLARVREELKALEEPIKAEIMQLRERLEQSNRSEAALVDAVNALRTDLFTKEESLNKIRKDKQDLADNLIRVMADYEKRKTERLNEIAHLVGSEPVQRKPSNPSNFAGF